MGDRRKGDRRAPEEGVIRIQKKNIWIYVILIIFFIIAVVLNVITWSAYIKNKKELDTVIDHYYNEDLNNNNNSSNTENVDYAENAEITRNNYNYSCNMSVSTNKTSIKAGESIEYEIKISDINANEGIKAFETYINYDSNLFDCSVKSNEDENWSKTGFLEGYLTMVRNENENTEDQVIAKIVFTAKNDITANNYKVNFTKNKFTVGDDQVFEVADNNIEIKVVE